MRNLRSFTLPWPRRRLTWKPTLLVAFCSGNSRDQDSRDADSKSSIKSKIFGALECKAGDVARKQLDDFFTLDNVTLKDCNQLLKKCWLHVNPQVANLIWTFMVEKHISPNTYSIACLLTSLSQGEKLDEALKLLYKLGEDINVQPHIALCSIFLNGCCHANSAYHAEKCLRFIKEKGLNEDESVYLELLKLAARRKDLPAVHKAWSLIVNCCKPALPSLQSYSAAIKGLCLTNSLPEAFIALLEMVQLIAKDRSFLLSEKNLDILSYLNSEYVAHSDKTEIMEGKVLEIMWGKESLASCDTIDRQEQSVGETERAKSSKLSVSDQAGSALTGHTPLRCNAKMQDDSPPCTKGGGAIGGNESLLDEILKWIKLAMVNLQQSESKDLSGSLLEMENSATWVDGSKFDVIKDILRESINFTICASAKKREFHSAEVLFNQMCAVGLKPNIYSYNAMLNVTIKERGLEHAYQLVKSMEQHDVQPNTRTYNAILMGFCKKLEMDKAEALLGRMLQTGGDQGPSVATFNIILRACGILDDPLRSLRVFSKMVQVQIMPNLGTIFHLVHAFGRVNFPFVRGTDESQTELARRLQAIEIYMERFNLPHNFQTFNTVLAAFCTEGMANTVIRRLQLAEGRIGRDGLPILTTLTFNTAINACNQAQQWGAANDVFVRMQVLGLKPNRETYNIFMNGCAEQKKVDDAFCYLDKMQDGGLKPDLITYNTLIKVCCYAGDLDAAISLLRDIEESGMRCCDVTFVTILHCAVKKERIDMIEFLVEHMHRKKVKPTISICEHVVSAYLNCHQIEDAVEALRVLSIRMLPEGVQSADQSENILKQIFLEDGRQVKETTLELLKDAMIKQGAVSESLLASRLSGFGNAPMEEWNADESWWAKRLSAQYINFSL